MIAFILAGLLFGQTVGGPGVNNPLEIRRFTDRWSFFGLPFTALVGVPPGGVPYGIPDLEPVPQGQTVTYIRCFDPDSDEGLVSTVKVPVDWKKETNFHTYIAWSPTTATAGNVVWAITCSGPINVDTVWPATATFSVTAASPGVTDQLTNTFIVTIPGAGLDYTGGANCVLFRDADNLADTYPDDACLAGTIVTYLTNAIGNDVELDNLP